MLVGSPRQPRSSHCQIDARRSKTSQPHTICTILKRLNKDDGLACCVLRPQRAECIFLEVRECLSHTEFVHALSVYEPIVCILPTGEARQRYNTLDLALQKAFPEALIVIFDEHNFSALVGRQMLSVYASTTETHGHNISGLSEDILACFAAAIRYINVLLRIDFVPNCLSTRFAKHEEVLVLQENSVRDLELLNTFNPAHRIVLLNRTKTVMGCRLLRSTISQPLSARTALDTRYDAIEDLMRDQSLVLELKNELTVLHDFDSVLANLVVIPTTQTSRFAEQRINHVLLFRQALTAVRKIGQYTRKSEALLLTDISEILNHEFSHRVQAAIDLSISDDASWTKSALGLRHQRCYAIKSGVNGMLDIARQTYREKIDDSIASAAAYADELHLPITTHFDLRKGIYLSLPETHRNVALPTKFINRSLKARNLTFTTIELQQKNARVNDALNEVLFLSESTIEKLLETISPHLGHFHKVSDRLALLDMMICMADVCALKEYVRPECGSEIVIKDGRHAVHEHHAREDFVSNDTLCDPQSKLQLITGCNMAGKSMYLRQVALIIIMAQVGCFVPASYASFPVFQRLFTSMSNDNGEDLHSSGFSSEMQGIARIIREISPLSISIIDELGRGTSTMDSLAINLAVCEYLVKSCGFVLYTTHFWQLQQILQHKPGIMCLYLGMLQTMHDHGPVLAHRVVQGVHGREQFAMRLIVTTSLPGSLIKRAKETRAALSDGTIKQHNHSKSGALRELRKFFLQLCATLRQVAEPSSKLDDSVLKDWLANLYDGLAERLEKTPHVAQAPIIVTEHGC